jgi:hypothetical protein
LIGATNEKPRLRKQPGFSLARLREFILPNPAVPERTAAMILKAKAACGDDADSPSSTGLCSDFYVFKCVRTLVDSQGRRTGKDPITGAFYHEIPNSGYGEAGHSGQLAISGPDGQYTLYVLGGKTGSYWVDAWPRQEVTGNVQANAMDVYPITFSTATENPRLMLGGTSSSTTSITATRANNLPLLLPEPPLPEPAPLIVSFPVPAPTSTVTITSSTPTINISASSTFVSSSSVSTSSIK